MKNKKLLIFAAIITTIVLFNIFFKFERKKVYTTVTPKRETVTQTIEKDTYIYPRGYMEILLETKDNIKKVHVKPGDKVKKGQVLVELDDSKQMEQYNSAKSAYNQAAYARNQLSASAQKAQKQAEKYIKNIMDNSSLSQEQKEKMLQEITKTSTSATKTIIQSSKASIQATINMAYQQMLEAEQAIEARKIKAPYDTTVIDIQTDKYMDTTPQSTDLTQLSSLPQGSLDISSLNIENSSSAQSQITDVTKQNYIILGDMQTLETTINLTEDEYYQLRESKQPLIEGVFANKEIKRTATIKKLYNIPIITNSEPQYPLTIIIKNSQDPIEHISTGSKVKVTITTAQKENVLTLPINAILYKDDGSAFVKVLNPDESTINRPITTGLEDLPNIEVTSGLTEDLQIITGKEKPKLRIVKRF